MDFSFLGKKKFKRFSIISTDLSAFDATALEHFRKVLSKKKRIIRLYPDCGKGPVSLNPVKARGSLSWLDLGSLER